MPVLLDTDVVIHLRDGSSWIDAEIRNLDPPFYVSAISRVELENGAASDASGLRTALLAQVLSYLVTLDFGANEIDAYRTIVRNSGYSRRKTADRMTAATAISHSLPLVTLNGRDFSEIVGLDLIAWDLPT